MIKLSIITTIILVFLSFFTNVSKANSSKVNAVKMERVIGLNESDKKGKSNLLENRLNEIKLMDKSTLSKLELNQLLNEVRQIKTQLRIIDGGLFISAGALIVILVIVIFLI